ncbi:MAG: DUF1989 domain-containing protein, partial [Acetobacteraceae bacterium]
MSGANSHPGSRRPKWGLTTSRAISNTSGSSHKADHPMIELLRKKVVAGGRFSTRLGTGDRLRIVDLEGRQAVDFLVFAAELPADRYNAANTM